MNVTRQSEKMLTVKGNTRVKKKLKLVDGDED